MAIQAKQHQFWDNPSLLQFSATTTNLNCNGMVFSGDFNLSQQQQPQQQQAMMMMMGQQLLPLQQQHQQQASSNIISNPDFSYFLALHMEKQDRDVDQFIQKQNEAFRLALLQQKQQQLISIVKMAESKTANLLKKKEEEVINARRKNMELLECLRRSQLEMQNWQRIAKEHEDMALDLSDNLEQVRQNNYYNNVNARGREEGCEETSSCGSSCSPPPPACPTVGDEEEMGRRRCKGCNSRESCVIFLPCRHLCACKACAALLDICPVCRSAKQCCIEVFMA